MRELTTRDVVARFMHQMGLRARDPANVYFTGGVTALLHGWRDTTIDLDIKIIPDRGDLLRALPHLKESLQVNVELASPDDFIPELPGWRERSAFIGREGPLGFFHYDYYSQALSKIERGHDQDLRDVRRMLDDGLVDPDRLLGFLDQIEQDLHRYPAIDPASFRRATEIAAQRG